MTLPNDVYAPAKGAAPELSSRPKRVVLESPYNPPSAEECEPWSRYETARQNLVYARLALLDSLIRGESPFASHLLYTQVWSEHPTLRAAGIEAGLVQHEAADAVVFYVDLGCSPGMTRALESAGAKAVERRIFDQKTVNEIRNSLVNTPLEYWPLLRHLAAESRR